MLLPPGPADDLGQYVESLRTRIAALEQELNRNFQDEHLREERLEQVRAALASEVASVRMEVQRVEERLLRMAKETAKLVQAFRNSARVPQFARLQQRVDMWKGEEYISRDEFKRLVVQELAQPDS
jgi:hypothetical protein